MKVRIIVTLTAIAAALGAIGLWMGQQAYTWLPPQASAEAELVDDLFSFMVAVATIIVVGVTGTLTYSALFQRAGKYDTSDGPHIEGNITLEVVWTAIPFALVIWIAASSFQTYQKMGVLGPMEHIHHDGGGMDLMAAAEAAPVTETTEGALVDDPIEEIEVFSRQWAWEFRYPDRDVTSTELHLPRDRRVRFALESADVIHGFYIPAFRLKQDIIPNQRISFELTPIRDGTYRLRDSEYSGTYFAAMQADVVVESPEAYDRWLASAAQQDPTPAYNRAFKEYRKAQDRDDRPRWASVTPAEPPIVNYGGAPESK